MIRAALAGLLLAIGIDLMAAEHGPPPEPTATVTVTPAPQQDGGGAAGWPLWILSGLAGGGAVLAGRSLLARRNRAGSAARTPLGPLPQPLPVLLAGGADSRAPGVALDGGMLAQTTVRAVSIRGRRHRYRGEPLQDAYAVRLSADGRWVIAAVADGLGSTSHAEHAAAVAVRAATNLSLTPDLGWHAAFAAVAGEVMRATARFGGRTPNPPATTLTIGVVPADGRRGIAACAAIGDSPALWLHDGRWTEIFPPDGQRPDNVTSALPEDLGELRERQIDWGPGDVLVLCSDGFGTAMGGGGSTLAQRLVTSWSSPPALRGFLHDVDFHLSTYDDDRTVLAVWAGRHDTAVL
ncbi:protein phosphatase 2C domain-containing protein [Nonomuraea sp. MG754425]|uniref:protein phosphatase 2C domain-containing protein n=1 Tax=Nonomuraea sp. MG754425 TaxID=2570319 RepID=UPI001F233A4B|nr:protein phosphatase 2C domain-containing protein [Nonomuraea sp. MG754425]MCF6471900.1 protein phosphatase 2C domain-containing protein [Nonomuraea sp. MG754425]